MDLICWKYDASKVANDVVLFLRAIFVRDLRRTNHWYNNEDAHIIFQISLSAKKSNDNNLNYFSDIRGALLGLHKSPLVCNRESAQLPSISLMVYVGSMTQK